MSRSESKGVEWRNVEAQAVIPLLISVFSYEFPGRHHVEHIERAKIRFASYVFMGWYNLNYNVQIISASLVAGW